MAKEIKPLENLKDQPTLINLSDIPPGVTPEEFLKEWQKNSGVIVFKNNPPLQKVKAMMDDAGNWYVIPNKMLHDFIILLDKVYESGFYDDDAAAEFEEKFGKYRTGGNVNNIQLYADIK